MGFTERGTDLVRGRVRGDREFGAHGARDACVDGGVAGVPIERAERDEAGVPASGVESPGECEPVAAVVARAEEDECLRRVVREEFERGLFECGCGIFHEHDAWDPELLDGDPVELADLVGRECGDGFGEVGEAPGYGHGV